MARRPRISSTKAAKAASRGHQVPQLSGDAKGLLDAANGSSDAARNAWLAFLALLTYLLVTLGGVSHRDLLLNSGVTLPVVNIRVPLFSFFQYAPLLLLLVLLSLLIQHVMLARKYRKFVEAIAPYEKKARKAHEARELVHSYVVAQLLAGPKRLMVTSSMMRLMVFVTFALLPVLTLLYFQIKFVPYHDVEITYQHRVAVLVGLGLLFALLPIIQLKPRKRVVEAGPQGEAWRASRFGVALGSTFAILVIGFSWLIATVPGEGLDRLMGFTPPTDVEDDFDEKLLNPLVRFAYDQIPQAENPGKRRWLSSWLVSRRVLVVEDEDLVPDKDDQHNEVSVVLRGRKLQFARLIRSDLHRADLTKADLRGAWMKETRLEKARLEATQLENADLQYAKLQGADLSLAKLRGAKLFRAELRGANFYLAELQGANLQYATLQDANLFLAKLQGADLSQAELQSADLIQAELQGADLSFARLQGADLSFAVLQGADLSQAELQSADLKQAELQGADLTGAELQGADLTSSEIWLARFPFGLAEQSPGPLGLADLKMSPLTKEAKARLRADLQENITDGKLLERVMLRLDPILRHAPPNWDDKETWRQSIAAATEPSPGEFVPFLAGMACRDRGGHVANKMARRALLYSRDTGRRHYAKPLAEALLDENCQGAKALSDESRAKLEKLVAAE